MNNPEFNNFNEAREKDLSLKEIKESINRLSETQRQQLSHEINNQIIEELHKWLEVKRWDELNFLKALTLEWNRITWTNRHEANNIFPWDIIKIEWTNILKNSNSIWNVTGFSISNSWETNNNTSEQWENEEDITEEIVENNNNLDEIQESDSDDYTETGYENNIENEERFEVRAYSQDWDIYIIWENWEPKAFSSINMSEEFRESLEWIQETNKVIWNFELILNTLVKTDNEQYSSLQNEFNEKIWALDISSSESINEISNWINEKNIELNWEVDLTDDYKVIEYIRTIDSSSANSILVENLFHETSISEEELQAFIENPINDNEAIRELLGEEEYRNLRDSILEKKTQADDYFRESRDQFVRQLTEENWMSMQEAWDLVDNQYKNSIIDAFVTSYAKNKLLLSYVKSLEETGSWHGYEWENKMMEMFSDIQWIGYLDASDSTFDSLKFWSKEWFYILGTQVLAIWAWALTMWAWYVWVNALVWWTRWVRWLSAMNRISTAANAWSRIAKVWRWWAMSWVWWASFYAWYGWVESIAEWENMYSMEWLRDSIIFTWAFRALSAIPWLRLDPSKPLRQQKLRLAWATTLDAVTFSAIWLTLEWVILEPEEWNAELIMQAIVMAAAFRMAWIWVERLRFRKNWNKVEMLEWPSTTPINFLRDPQTWRIYTRTLDWKYMHNWKEHIIPETRSRNFQRVEANNQYNWTIFTPTNNTIRNSPLNPNRPNNIPSESQRSLISRLNENQVINSITSGLNERRARIFQQSVNWLRSWWKKLWNSSLDFLKNLTYRWFNWIERGRFGWPLNVIGFKWWPLAFTWTTVSSWEEISEIWESINNKNADVLTWDNWENLVNILFDLTLFKQLWLIRGATYNWALDEAFNYFWENDETNETTE